MRREHTGIQSNPLLDFLQAHNCIFYSPLSQTDTSDWISGNAITLYSSNSAVWDSANNIWKFQAVSGQPANANQYYAKWNLKETVVQTSMNCTAVAQLMIYSGDEGVTCYDFLPTRLGLNMASTLNQETQSAQVFYSDTVTHQKLYRNDNTLLSYDYTSILNVLNGATGVRIGCPNNNVNKRTFGMRNFAVFTQKLTLSEINEYFSLTL